MSKNHLCHRLSWMRNVQSRLAQHITAKTTECSNATMSSIHKFNPLETYFSASRDQVARCAAAPFLVLPSCLLPASHVTATHHEPEHGTPIFVHRDAQYSDKVRAYVNQCRHRGARLFQNVDPTNHVFSTPLRGSAVSCPYHAWTYDVTTGSLKGVPGEKVGFPCLDKDQYGLHKLEDCFESAGGIWLKRQGMDEMHDGSDLESTSSPFLWPSIDTELSSLLPLPPSLSSSSGINNPNLLVGYQEWHLEANWQILVETFLESYHVHSLHKDTLGLVAHSNSSMVTDVLDTYSLRMTVPLKNVDTTNNESTVNETEEQDYDHSDEVESFLSQTTTTYFLFPNTAISLFKRFVVFLSILPLPSDDSTNNNEDQPSCKSYVRAWATTHSFCQQSDDDDGLALARRDLKSVLRGIEEDWECAEGMQSGLNAAFARSKTDACTEKGSLTFSHGRFEGNNIAFLNHVGFVANELATRGSTT